MLSNVATPVFALAETVDEPSAAVNEEKEQAPSNRATIVQEGKWGTSPMTLDSDGVLVVKSGTLTNNSGLNSTKYVDPNYLIEKSDVKKIIFEGNVLFPKDCVNLLRGQSDDALHLKTMNNLTSVDFTGANMSNVETINLMFFQSPVSEIIGFKNLNFPKLVSSSYLFNQASNLKSVELDWATPNLLETKGMFNSESIEKITLGQWDTSKVTNMETMFSNTAVTELDLSSFDMSSISDIGCNNMFSRDENLKKLTLGPKVNFKYNKTTNNPNLPAIPVTDTYTGKWVNVEKPTKVFNSSEDFMKNYNGATDAGTYVWGEKVGAVTVNYVDEAGKTLASADTLTGNLMGEAYTTNPKEIANYQVKETPANANGTFSKATQTVTYVYEVKEAAPVTVNYVDTEGNELASERLTGKIGTTYTTEPKEFDGYTLKETPENANGTFTTDAQTVTYVYEGEKAAPITVTYLNQLGTEIAPAATVDGKVGQSVDIGAKQIEGYDLVGDATQTAKLSTKPQTVTFTYAGQEAEDLTVEYVDAKTGEQIAAPTTITGGKTGDAYTAEIKEIPGYTVANESAATGFRPYAATTIQITYNENEAKPFELNYVGVQQQTVVGFLPEGVTTDEVTLSVKKANGTKWEATGYSAKPTASGFFQIESRFVKGSKEFLLENQDQVMVSFVDKNNERYQGIQVVEPYAAPAVNEFKEGDTWVTGTVQNGANVLRLSVNSVANRTVTTADGLGKNPTIEGDQGIDARTGAFSIYGKTWRNKADGPNSEYTENNETKAGDILSLDYGVQIYGAVNNPSTTLEVK